VKLSSIIGQPRAVTQLRAALERGRVHHAWLFSGPEGTGKETAARAFAASLLCAAGGDQPVVEACGTCPSCQKLSRGVHPDLVVVLPESEAVARKMLAREDLPRTPSRELKIEQIRNLQTSLSRSPVEGKRRVVLLLGADSLNAAAQNAFLKTLEEPPVARTCCSSPTQATRSSPRPARAACGSPSVRWTRRSSPPRSRR